MSKECDCDSVGYYHVLFIVFAIAVYVSPTFAHSVRLFLKNILLDILK